MSIVSHKAQRTVTTQFDEMKSFAPETCYLTSRSVFQENYPNMLNLQELSLTGVAHGEL